MIYILSQRIIRTSHLTLTPEGVKSVYSRASGLLNENICERRIIILTSFPDDSDAPDFLKLLIQCLFYRW